MFKCVCLEAFWYLLKTRTLHIALKVSILHSFSVSVTLLRTGWANGAKMLRFWRKM